MARCRLIGKRLGVKVQSGKQQGRVRVCRRACQQRALTPALQDWKNRLKKRDSSRSKKVRSRAAGVLRIRPGSDDGEADLLGLARSRGKSNAVVAWHQGRPGCPRRISWPVQPRCLTRPGPQRPTPLTERSSCYCDGCFRSSDAAVKINSLRSGTMTKLAPRRNSSSSYRPALSLFRSACAATLGLAQT